VSEDRSDSSGGGGVRQGVPSSTRCESALKATFFITSIMDDNLSQPSFEPTKVKPDQSDAPNDPQSDDEVEEGEDGQVDWTKLMHVS